LKPLLVEDVEDLKILLLSCAMEECTIVFVLGVKVSRLFFFH